MLHDAVRGGYHLARAPDEVSVPGMGMHSAMAGSVLYYWLVIVQQVLTQRQGQAMLVILFVRSPSYALVLVLLSGIHDGCLAAPMSYALNDEAPIWFCLCTFVAACGAPDTFIACNVPKTSYMVKIIFVSFDILSAHTCC